MEVKISHTTTLSSIAIRDIAALRQAVAKLRDKGVNCELVENQRPRMYFTEQGEECEYVVKLPDGRYDVGLKLQADGSYAPVFDEYSGHVGGQIGADANVCPMPDRSDEEGRAQHAIGRLLQFYAEAAAINAAVAQGYSVDGTTTDEAGNIHVLVGVQ